MFYSNFFTKRIFGSFFSLGRVMYVLYHPAFYIRVKKVFCFSVFGVFPALDDEESRSVRQFIFKGSLHSPAWLEGHRSTHERPHHEMHDVIYDNRSVNLKVVRTEGPSGMSRGQMDHCRLSSMIIFYNPIFDSRKTSNRSKISIEKKHAANATIKPHMSPYGTRLVPNNPKWPWMTGYKNVKMINFI